jgi:hypothetical protein
VYAHLAEPLVAEGDLVEVGQVIGRADSTGSSNGSHLHLTLKRDGATERGETAYPKDILDPTPYLIMPQDVTHKSISSPVWPPGRALIGAHGRVGEPLQDADIELIRTARLEAVKLHPSEARETIERLREINPSIFLMVRLTHDLSGDAVDAQSFYDHVAPYVGRLYRMGVLYFEVHRQPNVQTEGWGRSWKTGAGFAEWLAQVVQRLRQGFPEARFGFPGLSSGGSVSGWRADARVFLDDAEAGVAVCDWVGVNLHWSERAGVEEAATSGIDFYRRRFPDKLLLVTEFYNPSPGVSAEVKARQYLDCYRQIRNTPGVGAGFAYALSAPSGHDGIVWRTEGSGTSELAKHIGWRTF